MWTVIVFSIGCFVLAFILRPKTSNKLPTVQFIRTLYEKNKKKSELYKFTWDKKPAVLLMDLDLIKSVLIKDFHSFDRRDDFFDKNDEFKSSHLANTYGQKWKLLRKSLSKAFYPCAVEDIIRNFKDFYWSSDEDNFEKDNSKCDMNNMVYLRSFRGIMNVAFGIEFPRRESTFEFLFAPHKKKISDKDFFLEKIQEWENTEREDNSFFNILVDLKNEDRISSIDVAAQTYVFCSAGTESVALSVLYCLYELAMNHDIQERLRQEVTEVLYNNNNDLSKNTLDEMVFLNCCFKGE